MSCTQQWWNLGTYANGQNMGLHVRLMVVLAVFLCDFQMSLLHFDLTGVILPNQDTLSESALAVARSSN